MALRTNPETANINIAILIETILKGTVSAVSLVFTKMATPQKIKKAKKK
jgi:hypothetical protein